MNKTLLKNEPTCACWPEVWRLGRGGNEDLARPGLGPVCDQRWEGSAFSGILPSGAEVLGILGLGFTA